VPITSPTLLASLRDTSNISAYATPTPFTPTASRLLVVACAWTSTGTATGDITGFSGGGLTWAAPLDAFLFHTGASPTKGLCWSWANTGASPGSTTVTATFGANQTGCSLDVFDVPGADTTAPRVQAVGGRTDAATTVSATLAAALTTGSATLAIVGMNNMIAINPRAAWTEINDSGYTSPTVEMETQYRLAPSERTGSGDKAGGGANQAMAILVVEIAIAAPPPGIGHPAIRRLGGIPGATRMRPQNPQVRIY
jgi:hypothetical protein